MKVDRSNQLAGVRRSSVAVVLIEPTDEAYDQVATQLVMDGVCSPIGAWPKGFSLTLLNVSK